MLGKDKTPKEELLNESDLDSFDNGSLFENMLKAKNRGKVVNRPNKAYTFPNNTPLIGIFRERKEIDNKGQKFDIFIFEHVQTGDFLSLTGKGLESLVIGNCYIIEKPLEKQSNGKKFKDFPIVDITEEYKESLKNQKKG